MPMTRRHAAGGAALLLASLFCGAAIAPAAAQSYPDRPVRVIVPFAPAGPTDVTARLLANELSKSLGQQFYVENIGGAGGNTGTGQAARATPDGYTIIVISTGFMVNASLYAKIPYDPVKDFAPITLAAASPNILVINPDVPAKNLQELVDLIKKTPGKYAYAQPGTGSTPHLSGELFKQHFKLDIVNVPFTGAGPAITSTIGGHTPLAWTALPPALGPVKDGKLRAIAVTSEKRSSSLPDVPTMAEAGVPGQEAETLTGVLAPAGTPQAVIDLLNKEIVKIIAKPEIKEKLGALGFEPIGDTPEQFGKRIDAEVKKWAGVIREAKIPQIH